MIEEIKETLRSLHPSNNALRLSGIILGALIILAAQRESADQMGGSAAGVLLMVLALAFPRVTEPIWKTLMAVTLPIGWLASRLVLLLFFYVVLSPISLILRIVRYDLMKRPWADDGTYWEPFEENQQPDSMGL